MKLSIVVPTYNQGRYIESCLASIRMQTFRDYEVIIQDAESSDGTEEICRSFAHLDSRFRYFREKDSGQSDAINRGLARSSGEFWTWICSDDAYANDSVLAHLSDFLERSLQKDAQVIGVYGNAQYITQDGMILRPYPNQKRDLKKPDFKMYWPLSQPSLLLLRKAVQDVGGVDQTLQFGMDLDLFIKLLEGDRAFRFTPHMIANVRVQPDSKSIKLRHQTAVNALAIIKKHFGNTGSLMESTFGHEYLITKRQAFRAALLRRLEASRWTCRIIAGLRSLVFTAWRIRNNAFSYAHERNEEKHVKARTYRVIWYGFSRFKKYFFLPVQRIRNKITAVKGSGTQPTIKKRLI